MVWKDKHNVSYVSTEFENVIAKTENRRKEKVQKSFLLLSLLSSTTECSLPQSQKPLSIIDYNKYMSGINRQDQMISYLKKKQFVVRKICVFIS